MQCVSLFHVNLTWIDIKEAIQELCGHVYINETRYQTPDEYVEKRRVLILIIARSDTRATILNDRRL